MTSPQYLPPPPPGSQPHYPPPPPPPTSGQAGGFRGASQPADPPPAQPPPSARSAAAFAADDSRVRRTSLRVGLYVGIGAAVILLVDATILIAKILRERRSVLTNQTGSPGRPFDWVFPNIQLMSVVDPQEIIQAIIIMSLLSVILVAVVAWLSARRAAQPLAEALRLQRHFVADASHELRTPLTVLSTRVQLLQHRLNRGENIQPIVAQLRDDAARMADVLNDLLLTVEDSGRPSITPVQPAVAEAVASLQPIADAAQVQVQVTSLAQPTVTIPPRSLARAIVALVDNAIQHSPAGSRVDVIVSAEGSDALIRVRDWGSGIASGQPQEVFERFAHGRESGRQRSFGLGLALVSEIAQRSHGDITVESTGSDGTTFLLRLPLAV